MSKHQSERIRILNNELTKESRMMNIIWAPGQSDASKEIIIHLTGRERASLIGLNFLFGLCAFAIPLIIMGSTLGIGPFQVGLGVMAVPLVGFLVFGIWMNVTLQRRILLGTQIAKERGFTVADISARHTPSRREYLAVGVIASLAVIISAAGFIMAAL